MKKMFMLFAIGTVMSFSVSAQDDDKKAAPTTLSVGLEAGLPMGDFGKVYSFGIGGSAKVGIPAGPGAVTISAGYMTFSGKDLGGGIKASGYSLIPLKAGYRFGLGSGFNVEPQVGYSVGESSTGGFTYAGNVGYMFSPAVDVALRYEGV